MLDTCPLCAKYPTRNEKDFGVYCSGCTKPVGNCLCDPLPNLTVNFDQFVDYAWMEKDPTSTINGLPQIPYTFGALCEEAGEAFGKIKKMYRDDRGQMTDERKAATLKELGDVAFYLTKAAHFLGVGLARVLDDSKEKNLYRMRENKQHGDGDDR